VEIALASFFVGIDRATERAPGWLRSDLDRWKEAVAAYTASKGRYTGTAAPATTETIEKDLEAAREEYKTLQELVTELYEAAPGLRSGPLQGP